VIDDVTRAVLRELGEAWRGDWSGFNGRDVRGHLADVERVADGHLTLAGFRRAHDLCPRGGGHWTEHCRGVCVGLTVERVAELFDVPIELLGGPPPDDGRRAYRADMRERLTAAAPDLVRPAPAPAERPPDDYLETLRRAIGRVRAAPIEGHRHVVHPDELTRAQRGEPVTTRCADCFDVVVLNAPEPPPAP
jgi:hypothetical protein